MRIGQGGIGKSKLEQPETENRSGAVLMREIREKRKALRDQHREDQAPPSSVPSEPRKDDS